MKQDKLALSLTTSAAVPAAKVPPALSRGEVRVLETLYSTGPVPRIRKQALDFGLGLDAAGMLEEEGILNSSLLTDASISSFQMRLNVSIQGQRKIRRDYLEVTRPNSVQSDTNISRCPERI